MTKCVHCGEEIPAKRLEALPDTQTCIACSDVPKKFGLMDYSHKTAPSIVIVEGNDKEAIRRMQNVYHRRVSRPN